MVDGAGGTSRKWYVVTVGKGELPKGTIVGEMYGETEQEAREMLDYHLQGRCLDMFELKLVDEKADV